MKTKQYLAMMFAATALFACNNDDAPKPEEMGEAGKAWASFSISIPKTKAADTEATAEEAAIKTVTLYQGGAGVGSSATELTTLAASQFTPGADNTYTANVAVKVTGIAGKKCNIFAVVNKTNAITDAFIKDDGSSPLVITDVAELKDATSGFVMSSKKVESLMHGTEAEAIAALAASPTLIAVERAVSKVLVKESNALNTTIDFSDANSTGEFTGGSVKWQIGNSNKKFNVIPNTTIDGSATSLADFGIDPNWAALTGTPAYSSLAGDYVQLTTANYSMVVAANVSTPTTPGTTQYCVENNNETYQIGNTSYVSVVAEFTPTNIVVIGDVATGNIITPPSANTGAVDKKFYYNTKLSYYFNTEAYEEYTATNKGAVTDFWGPYIDGKCYYHVPIGDGIADLTTAKLGVIRNHLYTLTINSLKAPGNPLPTTQEPTVPGVTEPEDPKDPIIPSNAWIAVKLDVEAWTGINMGAVDLK